jgi:hypothetical protein
MTLSGQKNTCLLPEFIVGSELVLCKNSRQYGLDGLKVGHEMVIVILLHEIVV